VWETEEPGTMTVPNPRYIGQTGAGVDHMGEAEFIEVPRQVLNVWAEGFLPEFGIRERARRDKTPYDVWAKDGTLTLVPGKAIDEDWVASRRIWPMWGRHRIEKAGFDRWGFKSFSKSLKAAGMSEYMLTTKWEPVGMGTATMTPVLKELERRLLQRTIRHPNIPVLNMAASNAVVAGDAEARRLSKRTSRARIDPLVAVVIALAAWLSSPRPTDNAGIVLL
jgi:phage terminase large subunit-like protein